MRITRTPRRSPRRSSRRRSRARSTLRFSLARLPRVRAFSPLARRELLLRDLSFAHDSAAPRARDWPSRAPFSQPLRAPATSLARERRDDAVATNVPRALAPTRARERRSRLVPGASRDSTRPRPTTAADDAGRRSTRASDCPTRRACIGLIVSTYHYKHPQYECKDQRAHTRPRRAPRRAPRRGADRRSSHRAGRALRSLALAWWCVCARFERVVPHSRKRRSSVGSSR